MSRFEQVEFQLSRLRNGYRLSRTGLGLLALTAAFATAFAVLLVGDLLLHFPLVLCWASWLTLLVLLGGGLYVTAHLFRQRMSDASMAVLVESALPSAENRVINAVHLARSAPQAFVEHLLAEDDIKLERLHTRQLCSPVPFKWLSVELVAIAALLMLLFVFSPRGVMQSSMRLFMPMAGIEPYTLTRIVSVNPGDATLLRGNDLGLTVDFAGICPDEPVVVCEQGSGKELAVTLTPLQDESERAVYRFQCSLQGVFTTSRYRVLAGDARSRWYTVEVTNPPGVLEWEARVVPPAYVGVKPYTISKASESLEVPAGSEIALTGEATCSLAAVSVSQDGSVRVSTATGGGTTFKTKFNIGNGGRLKVHLEAVSGLTAEEVLPFVVALDQAPLVVLVDTDKQITARVDAQIPLTFRAEDDYGIQRVGIERLHEGGAVEAVNSIDLDADQRSFASRFIVDLPSFAAVDGDELRFRIWAEDNAPEGIRHRSHSPVVSIQIPRSEDAKQAENQLADQIRSSLLDLIRLQRANLRTTRNLAQVATLGGKIDYRQLRNVQTTQTEIRDLSIELVSKPEGLGDLRATLTNLVNHEMADVIALLDRAHRLQGAELDAAMQQAVGLENRILATLTGMPGQIGSEEEHQRRVDLLGRLQRLVAGQATNLKDSREAITNELAGEALKPLVQAEDRLAIDFTAFTDQCWAVMENQAEDGFRERVREVYDLFQAQNVYENMLTASESLEFGELRQSTESQGEILKVLVAGLNVLNQWRVENAKDRLAEALKVIEDVGDRLAEMEEKQAQICEVTRDMTRRGKMDDDLREELGKMDREQEEMGAMIEKLAQDLYQFPELPVCNELNSKMFEIFEDVEQAADSENAPSVEIAVQKEDSLLDAIRDAKERVEDVEMWLPEVPDNIVWNMESFDTDEFPDMPLVPLPDELEDLVGNLLDQASEIDAQSQDTTGNNMMADGEMGWDVMDGPMPNFSAKGKSGNTRPNDNEMTGRSGAGREGQSNGELVEDHVKGLEGRETHARRTQDPLQAGQVTEDENSTLDARSTGGGKLGGESESIGMFGNAPRRDTHVADHGANSSSLRRETEALYATARLLYLSSGSLGTATHELRGLEDRMQEMKSFDSLHRKVLRQLRESQTEIANGVVLPLPVQTVSRTGGAAVQDINVGAIGDEYRDIVSDYYKGLETE